MYSFIHEVSAGYLVLRLHLEKLLSTFAEWEPAYGPGTMVVGRGMGKRFAALKRVDIASLLAVTPAGESLYIVGNAETVTYLRFIPLADEQVVVMDSLPSLLQFEYDRSYQSPEKRHTEGLVLYCIHVIVPFILLTEQHIEILFVQAKRRLTDLERTTEHSVFETKQLRIRTLFRDDVIPPRTIFIIEHLLERIVWQLDLKLLLFEAAYIFEEVIEHL